MVGLGGLTVEWKETGRAELRRIGEAADWGGGSVIKESQTPFENKGGASDGFHGGCEAIAC